MNKIDIDFDKLHYLATINSKYRYM